MKRHYIFDIFLTVSLLFIRGCTMPPAEMHHVDSLENTVLIISFDGFRWDYINDVDTPNIDALIADGVKAERMLPSFPSKTFPNHYTLVTGLYPEHHGIVANNMYDPEMDEYFAIRNRDAVEDSRWWGGEPIWLTNQRQGNKSACYFWVGSERADSTMRPTWWKKYDGSVPNTDRIDQVLAWLEQPEGNRPSFLSLYFSILDDAGHRYGPGSDEVKATVKEADELMGYLMAGLKLRGIDDKLNVIMTADHGMANLSNDRVVILDDYISLEDVKVVDWSPVMALWPNEGKLDEVYTALKDVNPHVAIYKKEDVPARFHFNDHRRIAPIVGILEEGWTLTSRDRFESRGVGGATHGFDHELPSMSAIFVAHGPAFRQGVVVPPFQNIQVYNLMAHILEITPAENDGDFAVVEPMLRTN